MGLGMGPLSIPTQLAAAQVTNQEFAQVKPLLPSIPAAALPPIPCPLTVPPPLFAVPGWGGCGRWVACVWVCGRSERLLHLFTLRTGKVVPSLTRRISLQQPSLTTYMWVRRSQYFVTLNAIVVGTTALTDVTAASFGMASNRGGVILDSGSTLAVVPNPVLTSLVTEVCGESDVCIHICVYIPFFFSKFDILIKTVMCQNIVSNTNCVSGMGKCWSIFSGL